MLIGGRAVDHVTDSVKYAPRNLPPVWDTYWAKLDMAISLFFLLLLSYIALNAV